MLFFFLPAIFLSSSMVQTLCRKQTLDLEVEKVLAIKEYMASAVHLNLNRSLFFILSLVDSPLEQFAMYGEQEFQIRQCVTHYYSVLVVQQ